MFRNLLQFMNACSPKVYSFASFSNMIFFNYLQSLNAPFSTILTLFGILISVSPLNTKHPSPIVSTDLGNLIF